MFGPAGRLGGHVIYGDAEVGDFCGYLEQARQHGGVSDSVHHEVGVGEPAQVFDERRARDSRGDGVAVEADASEQRVAAKAGEVLAELGRAWIQMTYEAEDHA